MHPQFYMERIIEIAMNVQDAINGVDLVSQDAEHKIEIVKIRMGNLNKYIAALAFNALPESVEIHK